MSSSPRSPSSSSLAISSLSLAPESQQAACSPSSSPSPTTLPPASNIPPLVPAPAPAPLSQPATPSAASVAILLPEELLLSIFSNLEYNTLLTLAQVSKEFNRISTDSELWKHLFELHLDLLLFVQNTTLTLNKPSTLRLRGRSSSTSTPSPLTWKQFYYDSYFKSQSNKNASINYNNNSNNSSNNNNNTLFLSNDCSAGLSRRGGSAGVGGVSGVGLTSEACASYLRVQRSRILYIGPKKSGKSTLFYHLKFGTAFKGIYYLRKFGTVVSIDLALATKAKKGPHSHPSNGLEPHASDILPADLEVHDVEDFEALPFKRIVPPDGVIMVVDSTTLADPVIVYHLVSLLASPHIGSESVPILVLATRWGEENAMKAAGVARVLGVWDYPNRPWRVQMCSVMNLLGVREGLQWLHTEMKDRKSWEFS